MSYPYLILHSDETGMNFKLLPDGVLVNLLDSVNYLTRAKVEAADGLVPTVGYKMVLAAKWDALTFGPCKECDGDGFVIARKVVQVRNGLGGEREIKGYENHEDGELPHGFHPRYEPVDCRECDENGEALILVKRGVRLNEALIMLTGGIGTLCHQCERDFFPESEDETICDECLSMRDAVESEGGE